MKSIYTSVILSMLGTFVGILDLVKEKDWRTYFGAILLSLVVAKITYYILLLQVK